jgi:hypothetical protein
MEVNEPGRWAHRARREGAQRLLVAGAEERACSHARTPRRRGREAALACLSRSGEVPSVRSHPVLCGRPVASLVAAPALTYGRLSVVEVLQWAAMSPGRRARVGIAPETAIRYNMSIDADPQQQEAAPPQVLVVRSSSRSTAIS